MPHARGFSTQTQRGGAAAKSIEPPISPISPFFWTHAFHGFATFANLPDFILAIRNKFSYRTLHGAK
jgi:hypothetical protein